MRILTIAVLFCFAGSALAEDKKPDGTWTKKAGDFDLKFTFKKDGVVHFTMGNGTDKCDMEAKCTYEKGNIVKGKLTKFTKQGNFPDLKEGHEFKFKFVIDGKKAKLSDIETEGADDQGKMAIEGEYEKGSD